MTEENKKKYYVGRPNIGNQDAFLHRAKEILDAHWLTNDGPLVKQLESALSNYLGVKECILVSNGTIGLQLAAKSLDLQGEVILPSMTFVATAHALQWIGIKPVFVDINPASYNICPKSVAAAITPKTTAIVGVHLFGRACEVEELNQIAADNNLELMFDAAHSFGSQLNGKMIGNFGKCEVFSFHATKIFNTFEGGAITTNCSQLAIKLRKMRNFGFEGEDLVTTLGINAKMPEVNAAMGLVNLNHIDEFIDINTQNYSAYKFYLKDIPGISLAAPLTGQTSNHHYVVIEVEETSAGLSRDALKNYLTSKGVLARRYFYPGCHRMEPYASVNPFNYSTLFETDRINERLLALPTGTQLNTNEVKEICAYIRQAIHAGS